MVKKKLKFNSKTIHGGQIFEKGYGAVMPPIYQTSTYKQESPGVHKGFEYSRTHNPTREALQNSLASIENGKYGLAFASGLAAIDAITIGTPLMPAWGVNFFRAVTPALYPHCG